MKELTIDDVRAPIIRLALVMEEKLREHDEERGERGWIGDEPEALFYRIRDEMEELLPILVDCKQCNESDFNQAADKAIRECADVANFPMMIMDVLGEAKKKGEVGITVGSVAAMQARKIAAFVYRLPVPTFHECLMRSLSFCGWMFDEHNGCWWKNEHKVTFEFLSMSPEKSLIEMFADRAVVAMAVEAWRLVEKLIAEEKLNGPGGKFKWEGDPENDCLFQTTDKYMGHVEGMGFSDCDSCQHENAGGGDRCEACGAELLGDWHFAVEDMGAKENIYHSTDDNVTALTGDAARMLCEVIVIAHRAGWRRK